MVYNTMRTLTKYFVLHRAGMWWGWLHTRVDVVVGRKGFHRFDLHYPDPWSRDALWAGLRRVGNLCSESPVR